MQMLVCHLCHLSQDMEINVLQVFFACRSSYTAMVAAESFMSMALFLLPSDT